MGGGARRRRKAAPLTAAAAVVYGMRSRPDGPPWNVTSRAKEAEAHLQRRRQIAAMRARVADVTDQIIEPTYREVEALVHRWRHLLALKGAVNRQEALDLDRCAPVLGTGVDLPVRSRSGRSGRCPG